MENQELQIVNDFHLYRSQYKPKVCKLLEGEVLEHSCKRVEVDKAIEGLFPNICSQEVQEVSLFSSNNTLLHTQPLRVGCVLSGGQASGGHNVIVGLYEQLKKNNRNSQLFGFLNGPKGIYTGEYMEIEQHTITYFKNRGGFDMIRSGRNKIETEEQFKQSQKVCETLRLDGLVVIGGDDSNTNACLLAEYFIQHQCITRVIGCPKTIDGDLKNHKVEVSFGYDTACKTYAEQIGNLMLDTLSTKKYYHFIRLMGRSASHIALECALLTRPTYTIIGEEVDQLNESLESIVDKLVTVILQRAAEGKHYGIVLVPEGLIEFIPEMNILIQQINSILAKGQVEQDVQAYVEGQLTTQAARLLNMLPTNISQQLLLDRDPHGNVQVAKIETEKLLISMVEEKLNKKQKEYKQEQKFKFIPQSHYFGYEGRCAFPSQFDCNYCYNLGLNAGVLIQKGFTGLMSCITNLKENVQDWVPCGYPLVAMMHVEIRKARSVPVIKKALVQLQQPLFLYFQQQRQLWARQDFWRQVGPIQYEITSPTDVPFLVHLPPQPTLQREQQQQQQQQQQSQQQQQQQQQPFCDFDHHNLSSLGKRRALDKVQLPDLLSQNKYKVIMGQQLKKKVKINSSIKKSNSNSENQQKEIEEPLQYLQTACRQLAEVVPRQEIDPQQKEQGLRIGICLNGRQSPGGHNIIDGLLDFIALDNRRVLIGFLKGTEGLLNNQHLVINQHNFKWFRNQGGYHFLGRSADKLRFIQQHLQAAQVCTQLQLDGLVLVGASHTFTDAAYLANYFLKNNIKTKVITVPCTIDNNLGHHMLEQSVGFDTAAKMYSQLIGNIMIDSASAVKYWYFIRLMGRNPSHLVLEAALQNRPNMCVVSEEIAKQAQSLQEVVNSIADLVQQRAQQQHNFGCVLIPEGIISYIPLFQYLLKELNLFIQQSPQQAHQLLDKQFAQTVLSPWAAHTFSSLPSFTQKQLVLEREVHGGIQLSQIESERLFAHLVGEELEKRRKEGKYNEQYQSICHYFGYQGRSGMPSILDCQLGTAYGFIAGVLVQQGLTGYSVTARGIAAHISQWHFGGIPLLDFIQIRDCSVYGNNMPVVPSYDVSLNSNAYLHFKGQREQWKLEDHYNCSGPTQFEGPKAQVVNQTLLSNHSNYTHQLKQVFQLTNDIKQTAKFGVHEDVLKIIISNLENLQSTLQIVQNKLI